MRDSGGEAGIDLSPIELAAAAGIERRAVGIARPALAPGDHGPGDVAAAAEAWEDEAPKAEPLEGGVVIRKVLGLPPDGLLPAQPQPREVREDGLLVVRAAARLVDILDPEEKPALHPPGQLGVQQRRIGVAEVQPPVRARGEAQNRPGHGRNGRQ